MKFSRRFKAGCLMTLFAGFCGGAGFVCGVVGLQAWKRKTEQPAFMKWAAHKLLERLNPSDEQWPKLEAQINEAVNELSGLKEKTSHEMWDILEHAADGVGEELTPEQQEKWREVRPKRPAQP